MYASHSPATRHRLLVAIHDVTPAHESRLGGVFALLQELGIERYALLVVPNWHGAWPLEEHPGFAALLRARQERGAEILLHGLRHDEVGSTRSPWQHLRAFGRTAREGEFLSLAPGEAARRMHRGLETLKALGLVPAGFVPPAWLHGPQSFQLIADQGLDFTEDTLTVYSLAQGRGLRAPALRWSTRRAWRAAAGVAIAAARRPLERWRPLLRVAIHPSDMDVPGVERSVKRTLTALLRHRVAVSYRQALAPR
jgi:predicted deacetylase